MRTLIILLSLILLAGCAVVPVAPYDAHGPYYEPPYYAPPAYGYYGPGYHYGPHFYGYYVPRYGYYRGGRR